MTDHQPVGGFQRSGSPAVWGVAIGAFLLVLAGTVYFAAESLETNPPITDLLVAAILGFLSLALAWVIVGAWRTRHLDQ